MMVSSPVWALTPIPGSNFKVHIVAARNYRSSDLEKLKQAAAVVETIMNSVEFKNNILNFSYQGSKEFVQNNGLSNEQLYEYLMAGAEKYPVQMQPLNTMEVEFELYKPKLFSQRGVIGWTNTSISTIYVNQKYYRTEAIADVADNMVHEWCHKMGFDHDFNYTDRRPYSVPYGVGDLVGRMINGEQ